MSSEAACWQKLRGRSALPTNEQCLLDLDQRLQLIEAGLRDRPVRPAGTAAQGNAGPAAEEAQTIERVQDVPPIPVTERLPELHELDRHGRCWAYRSTTHEPLGRAWVLGTPVSLQLTRPWCSFTHWLPHWSLPSVEEA